jgi:4-amino-4-deoxy-L-arabinose transferase-like glycosyltransferase
VSKPPWEASIRWLLLAIILAYLTLGTLYAVFTPAWQAPDEPAHYNYIKYLADQNRFPILKAGDYPAAYLEEIKAARFPPEMSIEPIRYEFHQPPLYYLLVVPVYHLFGGVLLPLRLFSVGLSALSLLVAYWTVRMLAPGQPFLALGTAAFAAFLPMHLAMTAAANNDTLAELLLATILLFTIRYLKASTTWSGESPSDAVRADTRLLVLLGVTTGLGLVTKSSVYIALPLVLVAILARHLWLDKPTPSLIMGLRDAAVYLVPALALALPWWVRNAALYGGLDVLGLGRHNQVVAGQLRTAEFVAASGMTQLVRDFLLTSFRSFWGQFGWMGVLLDERLYQALAILAALALLGFAAWLLRVWPRRRKMPDWQRAAGGLLALTILLTLSTYLWYNTSFLQHQGRYLFRALVPIGLAVALGWREALRRERAVLLAILSLVVAAILRVAGLLPTWPLLMLVATAAAFALRSILPSRWDPVVHATPYALLILLDLISLFFFVVPQLTV